jgi:hypothetical protein
LFTQIEENIIEQKAVKALENGRLIKMTAVFEVLVDKQILKDAI